MADLDNAGLRTNHAMWADNVFIICTGVQQAVAMTRDLINVLTLLGLQLKWEEMMYITNWPLNDKGCCRTCDVEAVIDEETSC